MKSLEELTVQFKEENKNSLDNIILAILSLIEDEKIPTALDIIHPLFYEISKKTSISQLKSLVFYDKDGYSYSEKLHESFMRLEQSGLLSYTIGESSFYIIKDTKDKQCEAFSNLKSEEQQEILNSKQVYSYYKNN